MDGSHREGVDMTDSKNPQQIIDDILGRWSVTDLREQTDEDLLIGDERFYKATGTLQLLEEGKQGVIRWWKIASSGKEYECRRFERFVFCSCLSFFFSKKMCKHLAITTRVYCARCFVLSAKVGKYCDDCDYVINHFLKPAAQSTFEPLCPSKF